MHIDVNSFILNKVNKVHTSENAKMRYSDHGILLRLVHSGFTRWNYRLRLYSTLFTFNIGIKVE